jgi:hypothetical protein
MKVTDNKHLSCLIVFMVLINSQYGVVFASPGIKVQPPSVTEALMQTLPIKSRYNV